MMYHTGIAHRILFTSLIWQMPGPKVFLTFDDGPNESVTSQVLDVLQQHQIHATFFLTGRNIPGREQIVQRIDREGHSIGIHAYNHSRMLAFSKQQTIIEIKQTEHLITEIIQKNVRLFRPPFGFFTWHTISALRELQYIPVMWSCLSGDYMPWRNEKVIENSLKNLTKGSILVFHDNDLTKDKIVNILDQLIPKIKQRGFEFGAIR